MSSNKRLPSVIMMIMMMTYFMDSLAPRFLRSWRKYPHRFPFIYFFIISRSFFVYCWTKALPLERHYERKLVSCIRFLANRRYCESTWWKVASCFVFQFVVGTILPPPMVICATSDVAFPLQLVYFPIYVDDLTQRCRCLTPQSNPETVTVSLPLRHT